MFARVYVLLIEHTLICMIQYSLIFINKLQQKVFLQLCSPKTYCSNIQKVGQNRRKQNYYYYAIILQEFMELGEEFCAKVNNAIK